jgi:hypothetical protein
MMLLLAPTIVISLTSFVRCQRSARDQAIGRSCGCGRGAVVGLRQGCAPCGVVRSDVVDGCGLAADFAMKLCTDVGRLIFDEGNVKGCALALEDRIGMFP